MKKIIFIVVSLLLLSISFSYDKNNKKCYIPMFGINGGIDNNGNDTKKGLYFNCNDFNKEEIIKDHCKIIKEKLKNKNYNWNEFKKNFKKYEAIFLKGEDNKLFYNTYCINDQYKKEIEICITNNNYTYEHENKKVKYYNLYEYLKNGAYIGKCVNNKLNFFGNINLNICIPFAAGFEFNGGTHHIGHGHISFNTNCNKSCYIPLFSMNGNGSINHHSIGGDFKFGIYYNCNEDRKKIIENYCDKIKTKIIANNNNPNCSFPFGFMKCMITNIWDHIPNDTWKNFIPVNPNLPEYTSLNYISVFENPQDNKLFYEKYCTSEDNNKQNNNSNNNGNTTNKQNNQCNIDTNIDNGNVTIHNSGKYNINIKYLGGYFGTETYSLKTTSKIKVGSNYYDIGDYNNPLTSDVSSGGKEINIQEQGDVNVQITSTAWDVKNGDYFSNRIQIDENKYNELLNSDLYKNGSIDLGADRGGRKYYKIKYRFDTGYISNLNNWYRYKTIVGDQYTKNVIVLKKGDSIDKILANYDETVTNQVGIKKYIEQYVKDNKINIQDNQLLYLFEFNDIIDCTRKRNCDYQDLVTLITIDPLDENNKLIDCSSSSNNNNNNNNNNKLPPYVKVDYDNSTIIFEYSKRYGLNKR